MSDQAATDAGVPAGRPADWQASTVVVEAGAGAPDAGRSFVVWTAKRSICRQCLLVATSTPWMQRRSLWSLVVVSDVSRQRLMFFIGQQAAPHHHQHYLQRPQSFKH